MKLYIVDAANPYIITKDCGRANSYAGVTVVDKVEVVGGRYLINVLNTNSVELTVKVEHIDCIELRGRLIHYRAIDGTTATFTYVTRREATAAFRVVVNGVRLSEVSTGSK